MSITLPSVAWEAKLSNTAIHPTIDYYYTCTVDPININDPGYDTLIVGYYIVDYIGHIFEIIEVDGYDLVVYDLIEDTQYTGPYNDEISYVFDSLHKAALLAQGQLNRLDESAEDFIRNLILDPKGVSTFTELTDTPSAYTTFANQAVTVTSAETGLEFTSIRYTNAIPVPEVVGGVEVGDTFTDETIQDMFDTILYPYQTPTFSAFAISEQDTYLEVGQSIASNRTFTWTSTNPTNIATDSLILRDYTGATNIATGLTDNSSELTTYPAITKTAATYNRFRLTGTDTKSDTFYRDYLVYWYWMRYYGESTSTTLDETDIEGLRIGALASGFATTYSFNASAGGYKYICYPAVLGTATVFKDTSTQLPVPMEPVYTVSVTNTYGITTDYNVHRSTNILNDAINIIVT
jgi:hypothetical protein